MWAAQAVRFNMSSLQHRQGAFPRDRTSTLINVGHNHGKGFNSRTSRQKPLKSACFATKMLPKHVPPICYQTDLGRGLDCGGTALFSISSFKSAICDFR